MNRLIGESLICLVSASLLFSCGCLVGGLRFGAIIAWITLASTTGYCHGMRIRDKLG